MVEISIDHIVSFAAQRCNIKDENLVESLVNKFNENGVKNALQLIGVPSEKLCSIYGINQNIAKKIV